MTNSLCIVCKTNPKDFVIVDQVIVFCIDCAENNVTNLEEQVSK